jgi:hypothetical protein
LIIHPSGQDIKVINVYDRTWYSAPLYYGLKITTQKRSLPRFSSLSQ